MMPVPRNVIASEYEFQWSVALSCDRSLIGADESDEMGDDSGASYIFYMTNGVWQGEQNIFPADGESGYWFVHDVALSGDTYIIEPSFDDNMGENSGSVFFLYKTM